MDTAIQISQIADNISQITTNKINIDAFPFASKNPDFDHENIATTAPKVFKHNKHIKMITHYISMGIYTLLTVQYNFYPNHLLSK